MRGYGCRRARTDLQAYDLTARGRTTLTSGETGAIDLAVSGNLLYWTNTDGSIRQAPIGGGNAQHVTDGPPNPGSIAVANGFMYWTVPGPPPVIAMAATAQGSTVTQFNVSPVATTPTEIAVFGSQVYWLQVGGTNGTVQLMPTTGAPGISATGTQTYGALGGLAADSHGIYFTAAGPTGAYLAVTPAAPPGLLSSLTPPPGKLAMNNTFIYFIDNGGKTIEKIMK